VKSALFRLIPVFLIVFSVLPVGYNARATGEWLPPDIIDQNNTPLEISAGRTYNNEGIYDTFIVLNQGPQDSLQVYNVEVETPGCVLAHQTNIVGFDGPLFGSAHRIVATRPHLASRSAQFYSAVIDDFRLKLLKSTDGGVYWDIITVSNNQFYGDSDVAVDPDTPNIIYVGGCNFNNRTYDIFANNTFGPDNFNLAWQVPDTDCALTSRVTRATFNVFNAHGYVLYGRDIGGNQQEIRLHRDFGDELIDVDDTATAQGGVIEVGQPTRVATGYIVTPYEHRASQTVKAVGTVDFSKEQPTVQTIGNAPNTNFYGVSVQETLPGLINILFGGGNHFELNTITKTTRIVNTNGNAQNNTGPNSWSFIEGPGFGAVQNIINPIFLRDGKNVQSYRAGFDGSVGCGEFIVKVPTIPTLSEWGLIALSGVLMLSGAFYLRRRVSA